MEDGVSGGLGSGITAPYHRLASLQEKDLVPVPLLSTVCPALDQVEKLKNVQ
ncbi:hypothetical protein AC249_AIPGENE10835 [Exaiptasia diaphana]|nr:hypothetical protein AC249_AIPGENE10835 [Exaiptasia diaphana]